MGSRPESDDRPLSQPTPSGLGSMAPRYAAVAVEKDVGALFRVARSLIKTPNGPRRTKNCYPRACDRLSLKRACAYPRLLDTYWAFGVNNWHVSGNGASA